MYILLWMTWSILLMRILLRWTVDLLLWLSSLIECFIIYRICFYYLFFDYSLQWWLRVWWFENFSIYCVRLLMLVVSLMFLIVSPNVINILFGWDGLCLVSYFLVFVACMLAVLWNRICVVALFVVIACIINFGSFLLSKSTSDLFQVAISVRKLKLCYRHPSFFRCHRSARPRIICDFNWLFFFSHCCVWIYDYGLWIT